MAASDQSVDQAMVDDPIMEIRDTTVQFDMERGVSRVLDSVDMDIGRREILGIVGESGSGKSMFASALLDAVVEPGQLHGEITYHPEKGGEPVDLLDQSPQELRRLRWEEISMVFQGAMSSFNPTQDIRTHFEETIAAHDGDMDERMDHARQLLSDLYLEPDRVLDAYPHELSGGMQQRALIALSLVLDPNVLVMDEPTAALDLLMQRSILGLLEELQEKYDLSIVFITHDLPLVAGLADRLAVMYAFDFVEVGESSEILADAKHPYTRALLRAVPNLDSPLAEMRPIDGSSPDPVDVPSGCSYHPRCPLSDDRCQVEDPPGYETPDGRTVACHYWEQSSDEIPVVFETDDHETVVVEGQQSEDPVLTLDDVQVHFERSGGLFDFSGETEVVHAVDGVDLNVYERDVVALVGESGCGKTTLGKTSIGVQEPTSGSVKYRGDDVWDVKRSGRGYDVDFEDIRRSLQIVHQDPGSSLNPNRSVEALLSDPLKRWQPDMNIHDRTARIMAMLETVGMSPPDDYAKRFPHQLSGGEKQRVALIRALLMNPDLILADEAVSALDVSLRVEMMDLMLDLQEMFNTSYLFISHNLSNARYLAGSTGGRIGVMYLGQIVEIGPAEEVINDPQHPYTQLLQWSTANLKEDEDQADEAPVRGIDIPDPVDPPSGCRFHTRCPEAREVCRTDEPSLADGGKGEHDTACFRAYDGNHAYWNSAPIEDDTSADGLDGNTAAEQAGGD